jgi:hypothetical protein
MSVLLKEVEKELKKTNVVVYIKNTTPLLNFIFSISQSDTLRVNNKDYEVNKLFGGMCGCIPKCIEFLGKHNFFIVTDTKDNMIFRKI